MNKLTGRIALVTGASKGIGAAVAAGLGTEGAYVYVNYCTDPTGAERTAAQIAAAGGRAETVGCDVASYEEIVEMFRCMRASRGAPDILVNCAGISPVRRFHELDRREIERVMNTNLMGAVYCSHEAVRSMKDTGGCIVNISSIHGTRAGVGRAVYAASKAPMWSAASPLWNRNLRRGGNRSNESGHRRVCSGDKLFFRNRLGQGVLSGARACSDG